MQREVPTNPPSTSLNPLKDAAGVTSVDYGAQYDGLVKKADNLQNFLEKGEAEGPLLRYLPGLAKPLYQGQIKGTIEKRAYADDTYKDLKTAEFNIQLSSNQYMNFHNVHLVFPMKIKKSSNVANNLAATEITVNNFFAHWIKEIDIKRLGDDTPILPTTNTVEIYKYSDAILKHIPKNALAVIQNDLLYSKKKVKLPDGEDRRKKHTPQNGDADERTDDNIDDRIQKFRTQLQNNYYYRIPLKYICDIGYVNTPIKFNTKWRLTFETNMSRLFESKTNLANDAQYPDTVDAKIILDSAPYLLFHQFSLEDTYRAYFEGAMISNQILRTGLKFSPYQKSYELVTGAQSKTFTFTNAFKQFAFLEFSLVFDKSDQHLNIYDSYNAETAATSIKYIKLQNASNTYSEFNTIKFNLEDEEDRFVLYNAFVAWVTKGSSIVPESDYLYNEVRQQLPNRNTYFTDSDEKVYIDIRRSKGYTGEFERVNRDDSDLVVTIDLKNAAAKKMRLYVTGYYQGEYMYMLTKDGLVMNHKEYSIAKIKNKS